MKAVILAAGRGTRLEPLTTDIPKCLVPVAGVPLIDRMIARIGEAGIDSVVVVSGHGHDALVNHLASSSEPLAKSAAVVFNNKYAEWGNYYSLFVAQDQVWDDDLIALDGDVLLGPDVLPRLLAADGGVVLAVDKTVELGDEEMKVQIDGQLVTALNKQLPPRSADGEFIGVERIGSSMVPAVWDQLRQMTDAGETDAYYERAFEHMMDEGVEVRFADISGSVWCEIDDAADLQRANAIAAELDA